MSDVEQEEGTKETDLLIEKVQPTLEWLYTTAKMLVDDEAGVGVGVEVTTVGAMFTLAVNPADIGQVIGKQGRSARSLRGFLHAAGRKAGLRYELNINEPK